MPGNELCRVCQRLQPLRRWSHCGCGWPSMIIGRQAAILSDERNRIRALNRKVHEPRQANEILRQAAAYFATTELDRCSKP